MLVGPGKWTLIPEPRPKALQRLICFHHAGGGAFNYRGWAGGLPADVELVAVQLPGRENRMSEPPLRSIDAVLDQLLPVLGPLLGQSYALFGHSLGGVLAYLTACRIRETPGLAMPARLFVSAAAPPAAGGSPAGAPLSDPALLKHISRLGGTPQALLDEPGLMKAFLPALRADLELLGQGESAAHPLRVPFTVLAGRDDRSLGDAALAGWSAHSTIAVEQHRFPGGHFYLEQYRAEVLALIARRMAGDRLRGPT